MGWLPWTALDSESSVEGDIAFTDLLAGAHTAWTESDGRVLHRARGSDGAWQAPRAVPGASSRVAPSLLAQNDAIVVAWSERGSRLLCLARLDVRSGRWSPVERTPFLSSESPSLAADGDTLWLAFRDLEGRVHIGSRGAVWTLIEEHGPTSGGPPVVLARPRHIEVAYVGDGRGDIGHVHVACFDRRAGRWSAPERVGDIVAVGKPSLVCVGATRHLVVRDRRDGRVRHCQRPAGRHFTAWQQLDAPPGRGSPVAVPVYAHGRNLVRVASRDQRGALGASDSAPQLQVDSKFMQNFQLSVVVPTPGAMSAQVNDANDAELLALDASSAVQNFYPDPTSNSGWNQLAVGMSGSLLTAGVDASGMIVVFAASGSTLSFATQNTTAPVSTRWNAPQTLSSPDGSSIAAVVARNLGGTLYLAIFTGSAGAYQIYVQAWDGSSPSFGQQISLSSGFASTLGDFTQIGSQVLFIGLSTKLLIQPVSPWAAQPTVTTAWGLSGLALSTVVDASGNGHAFAVLSDNNIYDITGTGTPSPVTTAGNIQGISAQLDSRGFIELFVIDSSNRLAHLRQDSAQTSGWTNVMPLATGVASVVSMRNLDGNNEAFAALSGGTGLLHLWQSADTTDWDSESLAVANVPGAQFAAIISNGAELTLLDAATAPLAGIELELTATAPLFLLINGAGTWIDQDHPATVTTNGAGKVYLVEPTSTFSSPQVTVAAPALSGFAPVQVTLNADLESMLQGLTASDLTNAQVGGQPLLPPLWQGKAQLIVDSIQEGFQAAGVTQDYVPRPPRRRGIRYLARNAAYQHGAPTQAASGARWRVRFGDDPSFERLTAAELRAWRAEHERRRDIEGGFASFITDWGDLWQSVRQGIVSVIQITFDAAVATVEFLLDKVTYAFDATVSAVQMAFDVAEGAFAQAGVSVARFFDAFGFLFDWSDILAAQQILMSAYDSAMSAVTSGFAVLQSLANQGVGSFSSSVSSALSNFTSNGVYSSSSSYQNQQAETPAMTGTQQAEYDAATTNNALMTALVTTSAPAPTALRAAATDSACSVFFDVLKAFGVAIAGSPSAMRETAARGAEDDGTAPITSYYTTASTSQDGAFSLTMGGMATMATGMSGEAAPNLQALSDGVFTSTGGVLSELATTATGSFGVPYVEALYAFMTSQQPSTASPLGVVSLAAAIPAAVFFKAAVGPIPSGTPLAALLAADGLVGDPVSAGMQQFLDISYGVLYGVYGILEMTTDVFPSEDPAPWILSLFVVLVQWLLQAVSYFGFFNTESVGFGNSTQFENGIWWYQSLLALVDSVVFVCDASLLKYQSANSIEFGAIVDTVLGVIHLVLFGVLAGMEASAGAFDLAKTLQNVFGTLSEMGKGLRLIPGGGALAALVIIDLIGDFGVMGTRLVRSLGGNTQSNLAEA